MRKAFIISYRLLKENLAYTTISAVGFGISVSLLLLVISFAWDRLSQDQFHPHPDRIHRVVTESDNATIPYASSPRPLHSALETSVGGVEAVTRIQTGTLTFVKENERLVQRVFFVTPSFLEVFGFPFQSGTPRTALDDPRAVVLSVEKARALFGQTDVLGAPVTVSDHGTFTVRGVIDTDRVQSHLRFDALFPLAAREAHGADPAGWSNFYDGYTYLRLQEGTSPGQIEDQIRSIKSQRWKQVDVSTASPPSFFLQPLSDVLFGPSMANEIGGERTPDFIMYFLGFLSLIIILTAVFNYVSLGVVQSFRRAREVGIRKTLGATHPGIASQFLVESIGIALLAFVVAVLSTVCLIPLFNQLELVQTLDGQISPAVLLDPAFYGVGLAIVVVVGIAAGAYPAFSLGSHRPVEVLRGSIGSGSSPGSPRWVPSLRQMLMGVQLTLSIAFIAVSMTLYQQSQLVSQADYGYPSDQIFSIQLPENGSDVIANKLRGESFVRTLAHTSKVPVSGVFGGAQLQHVDAKTGFSATGYAVDSTFFQVMNLTFADRLPNVYPRFTSGGVVLNQVAARKMTGDDASGIVGQTIKVDSSTHPVVGVVEDFHFRDLKNTIGPLVLQHDPDNFKHLIARASTSDERLVEDAVEETWKRVHPSSPFTLTFLQDTISQRYLPYRDLMRVLGVISLYAVLIACLGILGMTAQTVQQRIREIGIRKAVGATSFQVLTLLLRETGAIFGVAVLLGVPLAWYLNSLWLSSFVQQVEVGLLTYGTAVLLTALLALGTASVQALRGARQNVTRSLRHGNT